MTNVTRTVDLWGTLEQRGWRLGKHYLAFFDSTMARFWGDSRVARDAADAGGAHGRILSDDELKTLGAWFPGREYGEAVWLAEPGVLIVPSFMGSRPLAAMHGYHPHDDYSRGCFLTDVSATSPPASLLGFKSYVEAVAGSLR
jgi:hypothetical protein